MCSAVIDVHQNGIAHNLADAVLPFSVAAFCGAKKCNPCLRNVLLLYLGTDKTQRQFQMLSWKAAQGKDLPKVQHDL
jgi:hypothetical protein